MREKGGDSTRSAVDSSFDRHGVARGLAGLHALDGSKGSVALALVVRLLGEALRGLDTAAGVDHADAP